MPGMRLGLDLGTGFVKGVCDHGSFIFPSICTRRNGGDWSTKVMEKVGSEAARTVGTTGVTAIRPIHRGRPDAQYQKQVELLVQEAVRQARGLSGRAPDPEEKFRIIVGLPYHAFRDRDYVLRLVRKLLPTEYCSVVAQATGTMVDLGKGSGISVSVGQGTTEIVAVEDFEVVDGESSPWASDFVTKKVGKFAHLDTLSILDNSDTCRKYSRILAENLAKEVAEMSANHNNQYEIVLSGGGIKLPGLKDELVSRLKNSKVAAHPSPTMSNAMGMYKMTRGE